MLKLDARLKLFLFLVGGFVTTLILGDLIGSKLYSRTLFGVEWVISVGMIPFPVTFLLTDLINEFYGHRMARTVTWVGFWMAILTITLVLVAGAVPYAPFSPVQKHDYDTVLLNSLRIFFASMCAYLISQYTDIGVFKLIKTVTKNRLLWLRATGSTAVSQLIDTITINFVAWSGMMSAGKIINIIYSAYGLKLLIAVGLTPLIYLCHTLVERGLGIQPILVGGEAPDDVLAEKSSAAT